MFSLEFSSLLLPCPSGFVDLEECYLGENLIPLISSQVLSALLSCFALHYNDGALLDLTRDGSLVDTNGFSFDTRDPWSVWSKSELAAARKALRGYKKAVRRKEPGAREAYDTLRANRKAEVDPINEVLGLTASILILVSQIVHQHFEVCLYWAEDLRHCYYNDLAVRRTNMTKRHLQNSSAPFLIQQSF